MTTFTRFGKSFATTYGWASEVVGNAAPKFVDLEKHAELSHLRPYYTWQSHFVHADSRGWALNHSDFRGQRVLLSGATNVGLVDPAQQAMHSFVLSAVELITSPVGVAFSTTDQLGMESLLLLMEEGNRELVKVEPKIMAREASQGK